jgi:hypothetical protein
VATNGEKMTRAIDTQRGPFSVQYRRIIIPRLRRRRKPVVRKPGVLNNMDYELSGIELFSMERVISIASVVSG